MKRKGVLIAALLATLLVVLSLGAFMDDIETAKEGVVTMVGGEDIDEAAASGFVVGSKDGACYVITSADIDEETMERVYLWRSGTEVYNAVQVLNLTDYGVAVMKVLDEPDGLRPLIVSADATASQNDTLTVLGYDGESYLSDKELTDGRSYPQERTVQVNDVSMIGGVRFYQYESRLDVRTEGGPVLDKYGKVVGVNVYLGPEENDFAAVDIAHILPYLESAGIPVEKGMPYSTRSLLWLIGGVLAFVLLLMIVLLMIRRKRYVIEGLVGIHERKVFRIGKERLVMGRDPSQCSVIYPVDQKGISRRHCEVYYDKNQKQYMLLDLSSEGTFIYGKRMTKGAPLALKAGAKFYLADVRQIFEFRKK